MINLFIARFMIRFTDPVKFWWDVFILLVSIFICYMLPVDLAFHPPFGETKWWEDIELLIEIMFAVDVLVHFNTSVYDKDGNEIFDYKYIAIHYLTETHFWIDMISTIPLGVSLIFPYLLYYRIVQWPKFVSVQKSSE
jgi:hypothetical protein